MLNLWYYSMMLRNPYYLIGTIFVGLAALLALYAQIKVKTTYARYKEVPNERGLTGAQVARMILDANGMADMPIYEVNGELSDHFDPSKKTINLSRDVYRGNSIATIAVAAHECGHAIQYNTNYRPIFFRNAIVPFANMGNYLGWIAIMIGLALGATKIAWVGFFLIIGILLFQVVTLPVEFNASARALHILDASFLTDDEYVGAKRMLSAAALTYVAAVISTIASMLRILLVIIGSSRND